MKLCEYYKELEKHDWFYRMTDDHRVWQIGKKASARIVRLSKGSPEHETMHLAYRKHVFSGPNWGTEKAPKPTKPTKPE